MSKRVNAKKKISRRLGVNLWGRANDPSIKKNYPPGLHGPLGRRKESDYGRQLKAKQQLKGYYGNLTEKQFRKTFDQAVKKKGDTSENLIGFLESRLDAVVYRSNISPTVFGARQLINHKHIKVNGVKVNIPSYRVKVGDIITVSEQGKNIPQVIQATQSQERAVPEYISADFKKLEFSLVRVPQFSEVPYPVIMEPNLVIEFYSR